MILECIKTHFQWQTQDLSFMLRAIDFGIAESTLSTQFIWCVALIFINPI